MNFLYKRDIRFLVFWVGTKCTLRCKLCANLIPHVQQKHFNTENILKDLDFLCKNSRIKSLQIQGGEPFTHPDISEIIEHIGRKWGGAISEIEIATNAYVKLSAPTIQALKRNKNILVRISNYNLGSFSDKFTKILDENSIAYKFYNFVNGDNTWYSLDGGGVRLQDDGKVADIYNRCPGRYCITLTDGLIVQCGKIYAIKEIYNEIATREQDEIDLRKIEKSFLKNFILRSRIQKFFDQYYKFKEQCRFCNLSKEKFPAAEQIS